ncbi:hypothetical protein Asp14428_36970 [Actinoplanes sp. NBRC 14428]|uniref:DUF4367 domain-containing protein n=1 Tax=Pseudosporangium ferrugineum TaxID=439699 RepID=A0A2T0S3U7_9ACTN|nr:hypothetical protein [Pseudosporangium ferrugineum]PRY28096.1 hypothetical protein CLV70_109253 [Pseudosporangium ferrugineum]BCJ52222.1 hypothetical protein Asp14428_36970 [Actinoplanes sp. NBRC 14428]
MPEDDALIAELRALEPWLDTGEPADRRAAVRARLVARPARIRHRKRWIAAAVAALAGAVIAVSPARAAVVDAVDGVLRIVGIEVRAGGPGELPPRPDPLPSRGPVTLAQARAAAQFPVVVPAALGVPDRVELADPDAGGAPRVVTMTFRGGAVRFDQFDGSVSPAFLKSSGEARWTEVGGSTAIWLPGPHAVTYVDRAGQERTATGRLAAPTLIWSTGTVTYRLEGIATLAGATAVAGDLK